MTTNERNAWAAAYRIYEEFAPAMRRAAMLDDGNDAASRVFTAALEKMRPAFEPGNNDVNYIVLASYEILENVFNEARKRGTEVLSDAV